MIILYRNSHKYSFTLMALLIAVMIGGSVLNANAQNPENKPNFLVIVGDDFGYSDIGAFGSE
ncbi:MAG TPA: hypothetical protein VLA74_14240, partial [Nitrososphaeraceae archaeon]|nr:hypothetical protein [Nitrososphaeraceae archaeon]